MHCTAQGFGPDAASPDSLQLHSLCLILYDLINFDVFVDFYNVQADLSMHTYLEDNRKDASPSPAMSAGALQLTTLLAKSTLC